MVDTILVRNDGNLILDVCDQLEWAELVLATGGVIVSLKLLSGSRVEDASNSAINQFAVESMVVVAGDNGLGSRYNRGDIVNQVVEIISLLSCDGEPVDTRGQEGNHHAEGKGDDFE